MKDQASVGEETPAIKYDRALSLFTESVMKPDHDLRGCAHNQGCYEQLMEIRQHVLDYLKTLKEVTHHTNADESDEIETEKLIETKRVYTEKEYWEGKVPDSSFEGYLQMYGYEYTPVNTNESTKLATPLQEGEETKT